MEVVWEKGVDWASQVEPAIESVYLLVKVDPAYLCPVVVHSTLAAHHHSN
jgi:hypothetical protein